MTKEYINGLKFGKELDRLVAEYIFGWQYVQNAPKDHHCLSVGNDKGWWKIPEYKGWECALCNDLPYHYSEDINKAWEVVERIQSIYPYWRFSLLGGDRDFKFGYKAEWFGEDKAEDDYGYRHGSSFCATAPEAICKSALIAYCTSD